MKTAICQACGGTGELLVYDERHPDDAPARHQCNICKGSGMIEIEDNDDVLQTDSEPDYAPNARRLFVAVVAALRVDAGGQERAARRARPQCRADRRDDVGALSAGDQGHG